MPARFTAAVFSLLILFAAQNSWAAERNKIVFVSDLHMNVDSNYSWLVAHTGDVAQFLNNVNSRDDVAELVILGDLLDHWISPVENTPNTFGDVLAADNNKDIVKALQALCSNQNLQVTYVAGNHDMLSFQDANKDQIYAAFPRINIISDAPGLGAYTKDKVIWAEHGHRYTLFNAPDTWSHAGSHLPLGYFISRLVATKSARSGQVLTTPDVLNSFVQGASGTSGESIFDDAFIIGVFNSIALWCEVWPWDLFIMSGLDSFAIDPLVEEIALFYDGIYGGWPSRQDIVSPADAVFNDLGLLQQTADLIFQMPDNLKDQYPFTPRIILFGHTHEAAFETNSDEVENIYLNTGTWIDGKPMTWAEIEITDGNDGEKLYTVSLWYYGETKPRQSATLSVQPEAVSLGTPVRLVTADLDGDQGRNAAQFSGARRDAGASDFRVRDDLVGVTSQGEVYYALKATGYSWQALPGILAQVASGDLDGDGVFDIAGLTEEGQIYYTVDLNNWQWVPGMLDQLAACDLDGNRTDDLVGVAADGRIYYTLDLANWYTMPGVLSRLTCADLNGDGLGDVAGVTDSGDIFYSYDLENWQSLPGKLAYLSSGHINRDGRADLVGVTSSGDIFYTLDLINWIYVPGTLSQVAAGNFNSDLQGDLIGLTSKGEVYYTCDLTNWQPLTGKF